MFSQIKSANICAICGQKLCIFVLFFNAAARGVVWPEYRCGNRGICCETFP